MNRSGWTGFGPVRLNPKLHRFVKIFFPYLALTEVPFHFFPLPLCRTSPLCLTPPLAPFASRRRCLLQTALFLSVTPSLSRSLRLCLGHSVSVSVSPSLSRSRSLQICPSLSRSLCLSLNHSVSISVSPNLSRSLTVSPHTGVFHSHSHSHGIIWYLFETWEFETYLMLPNDYWEFESLRLV